MPRVIANTQDGAATLEETVEAVAQGFDPQDESSLLDAAARLERLGNNRDFLGDLLIAQLREGYRDTLAEVAYGPQVIVLSAPSGGSFLRANIWPGEGESCFRASGAGSFDYGTAHDQ
jgi:hypothetical protein